MTDTEPQPVDSAASRRRPAPSIIIVLLAIIAVLGFALLNKPTAATANAPTITVSGHFDFGAQIYQYEGLMSTCDTSDIPGGYNYIQARAQVVVADASGKTLGVGILQTGQVRDINGYTTCVTSRSRCPGCRLGPARTGCTWTTCGRSRPPSSRRPMLWHT